MVRMLLLRTFDTHTPSNRMAQSTSHIAQARRRARFSFSFHGFDGVTVWWQLIKSDFLSAHAEARGVLQDWQEHGDNRAAP
jgi:hypothetical protein